MPFCTKCGANVTGTFCTQCGTPAASATAAAPQPAMATPYAPPVAPGAPPAARKTSPIVWVLIIVLGLFVLGGISVAAFVAYVAHRVHQTVSVDGARGGLTLHTRGTDGKDAVVQFGGQGKVPSWVPAYPGSEGKAQFSVRGSAEDGEGGAFSFTTSDDPTRVKSFYSDKTKDMGMKVNLDSTTPDGGMIVAADESGDRRSLTVTITRQGGDTNVAVIYGRK